MTVVRPAQPPPATVLAEITAAPDISLRLYAHTDGDGEFEAVPRCSVCCRRRRVRVHNIRAKMGPVLQGRFGLGWRTERVQLAPCVDSHRLCFLAGNR